MTGISDNVRGAVLMMGSMAAFTVNDTFMKALSDDLPFFQALFLRSVGVLAMLAIVIPVYGGVSLHVPRRDIGRVALRSLTEIAAAYFFITALFHAPIANVTAILQALPLSVALAGAVFLGEPIGWRRLTAILIGFVGVLIIVRPGADGFDFASVYALITVLAVTCRDIVTRKLSRDVSSVTVALYGLFGVATFAGLGSLTVSWVPVSGAAAINLTGASVTIIAAYVLSVAVMRVGDIGFVAPFRYTSLLWAIVLGIAVFGDWPDALTLLGAAIVVSTGLFTLYQERRAQRRRTLSR